MFCDKCGIENRDNAEYCSNCGSKLIKDQKPPADSKPSAGEKNTGSFIEIFKQVVSDRYEIIRELGRGGMAIVFLAKDNRLDRKVALKLLPEEFHHDQNFRDRFIREAKIAAKLSHPNIVQIHDVNEVRGFTYYSMSYIEGLSLAHIIKKSGTIKPKTISRLGIHICFALQNAHEKNVIHRDIKPENILINKKRMPIVVDFGIAKALTEAKLSQTGMIIGTPHYMSPEQIKTGIVDGRSDIYSLGCVLYEMAVGKTPFYGLDPTALMYHHVNELPPPPHTVNKDVPKILSDLIMKALAKDPGNRFQTAAELGKALHDSVFAAAPPTQAISDKKEKAPAARTGDESEYAETLITESASRRDKSRPVEKAGRDGVIGDTLVAQKFAGKKRADSRKDKESSRGIGIWVGVGVFGLLAAAIIGGLLLYPNKPDVPLRTPEPEKKTVAQKPQPSSKAAETVKSKTPYKPAPVDRKTEAAVSTTPAPSVSDKQKVSPPPPSRDSQQVTKTADARKPDIPTKTTERASPVTMPPEGTTARRETAPDVTKTVTQEEKGPPAAPPERRQLAAITKPEEEKIPGVPVPERKPEKPVEKPVTPPQIITATITWITIPGGTFLMGDSQGDMEEQFECSPVHSVTVSSFEMSRDEITVEQYAVFLSNTGHRKPDNWNMQLANPNRPVVFVSWHDAAAFARWMGARLPTESEWEYASRSGLEGKIFPWGDSSPAGRANYNNAWESGKGWIKHLKPPGSFRTNEFGLNDMAGNVWEWCFDWFGPYSSERTINPAGVSSGNGHVVRGGGWNSASKQIRNSIRGPREPDYKGPHTGFRIASGGAFK